MSKAKVENKDVLKYVLPEDGNGLDKLIESAFKLEQKGREAIQIALVGIAWHAWKHGDWTPVKKLLDPDNGIKTGRKGAIEWAKKFIGLKEVPKMKDGKPLKATELGGFMGAAHIEANFQAAKTTMYWTLGREQDDFFSYNINDKLRDVVKSIKAMEAKIHDGKYTPEQMEKIVVKANADTIDLLLKAIHFEVINGKAASTEAEAPAPVAAEQSAPALENQAKAA